MRIFSNLFIGLVLLSGVAVFAQDRPRVVRIGESLPTSQQDAPSSELIKKTGSSRPTQNPQVRPALTNDIIVSGAKKAAQAPVKTQSGVLINSKSPVYAPSGVKSAMMQSINSKLGIPYRFGSTGPNTYDCSGFVWTVFKDAGVDFTRVSARTMWSQFQPVSGDEKYKFGTLVFFNNLGHVGIVVDEKGFYHASYSKGITYSPFAGYWEKRVVGFRRIPEAGL